LTIELPGEQASAGRHADIRVTFAWQRLWIRGITGLARSPQAMCTTGFVVPSPDVDLGFILSAPRS